MRAGLGQLRPVELAFLLLSACASRAAPPSPWHGGPWTCAPSSCLQRYPLFPDDGDWECADVQGAIVCRGGGETAGMVPGKPSAEWTCGDGAGPEAGGRRICVDLVPDLPEGAARGWRCQFLHAPERRLCRRDPASPAMGAACAAHGDCVAGTRCRSGRCQPAPPHPGCWLDVDCGPGLACRFGSCAE